jgi:2-polyprenyl-3-methyl-5-hydroxy-6-metoxy-1,4-benzoquinol methylase
MKLKKSITSHCLSCGDKVDLNLKELFDSRFGIKQTYGIAFCPNCGLEQAAPTPTLSELKHLYKTYYNFSGEKGTTYTRLRQRFLSSPLYRLWLILDGDISFHLLKSSGRLLDIGCNEGRGLEIYQHNGFEAEGLEFNETAAMVARTQGFIVHTELLEQFQPIASYDVAILSNVLEHSLDPKDTLIHVRRILKPDGRVYISCPNNQSWLRFLFGRHWINWHVPFHIVHFSSATLSCLLRDTGFQIIQIQQRTPALWVAHSLIARLFAQKGQPTRQLRSPLLVASLILIIRGLLFPLLWLGNQFGRGDCLVVTARKV